jgi:succinate dehydrogenase / fumarate reductase, cytochrome b subunit
MSTTVPSKRRGSTNTLPSRQGLADWISPFCKSSIGGKYFVAVTGLVLTGFVIVHMLGNLQVFLGPDAINSYAESLKKNGSLLWMVRLFLLTVFVVHIGMALRLNWQSKRARPIPYAYEQTVQASFASRHMVVTGLVILAFTIFHIAHFTLGIVTGAHFQTTVFDSETQQKKLVDAYANYLDLRDNQGRPDVYSMMIYGFRNPVLSLIYLVAQALLFLHLTHGVGSMFQTVGLNTPRAQGLIRGVAWTVALVVCVGNVGIVLGVWLGPLEPTPQSRPVMPATRNILKG